MVFFDELNFLTNFGIRMVENSGFGILVEMEFRFRNDLSSGRSL